MRHGNVYGVSRQGTHPNRGSVLQKTDCARRPRCAEDWTPVTLWITERLYSCDPVDHRAAVYREGKVKSLLWHLLQAG